MSDAIIDTLRIMPLLFTVLVLIELVEHRTGHQAGQALRRVGALGPLIGAGLGALPQCGGAIVASELFATRVISVGTLVAAYLATSDEALPILAAHPAKAVWLAPVLVTKLLIGLVAGFLVDALAGITRARRVSASAALPPSSLTAAETASTVMPPRRGNCCPDGQPERLPTLLLHAAQRGLRIGLLLLATTAILNRLTEMPSFATAVTVWLSRPGLQVVTASAFGLIPSCAPSVALTDLFIKGALGYPALIAGLCANAGVGLTVLWHETDWGQTLRIALLMLGLSIAAGLALTPFLG